MSKVVLRAALAAALLLASPVLATAEVIKIGLSGPMSGAGASWGLLAEWAAKQAADEINKEGGVKVDGKTYTFEAIAYDNKYTASEGAKVGQALINKDGVRYVVFALGMAPVRALQALSEREGAVLFTTAAGKSIKGPKFPYTFTQLNSPFERFPALYGVVTKQHPNAKSVVIVEPNDATGQEAGEVAKTEWTKLGVKVADLNFYERGTTEFAPLVTRIVSMKPDIVDFNEMPPSEVGLVLAGTQGARVERDQGVVSRHSGGRPAEGRGRCLERRLHGAGGRLQQRHGHAHPAQARSRRHEGVRRASQRHQRLGLGRHHGHP